MSQADATRRANDADDAATLEPRGVRPPLVDIADRRGQDELLQIRNDLMTVYRPVSADDPRLFPLRYARAGAGRDGRRSGLPPIVILPDGPELASVLPYDVLRRMMTMRGLDVIMVEHRGVGLSRLDAEGRDLPADAMRLAEVVGDVLAVLNRSGVERAVLYGVGYGAALAQILAAEHPERVHSLVLDSPLTSADDEAVGQRRFRELYWEGADPQTASIASVLRGLVEDGVLDGPSAGPVLAAVHEYGGPDAVGDLVDLLAQGRGALTWRSIREVLTREWLQSTPYVFENDLVARIARTELGMGSHADGGDLDPLALLAEQVADAAPFAGEPFDLHALSRRITAPTLVLAGAEDLVSPPEIARDLAGRIPGAHLLELPGLGHSILDAHPNVAIVAAWWSAAGCADQLAGRERELAAIPRASLNRALGHTLRIALLAERISPWKLRLESARMRREGAGENATGRRARRASAL
ncbi:alpha/beta fold hydrolase [Brachybacterium nesterenkovii]|uniref:Alpha/beta hydrolase fold n=1 Tax=Brachybacterium nesterenkovii TaxID=47847 RepID=A0A1X6X1A0_9MICO|nr:alpha/beta fold hydrolase [Brachybacterium nesterenkovii]SLM92289.1 alpha/beta hydrolase fold [Brachybacterium nesterenkovii]